MPRPKRFNFLNPPIDGNYLPPSGMWTDLSGVVALAREDVGIVKEIPNGSNAGPLLAPMWAWVGFAASSNSNWCAAYQTWVYGRYFKSRNLALDPKNPTGPPVQRDPQVMKGIHALRQQFARLGPANSSRLWKGTDKQGTIAGHDPRWVWYKPESAIDGDITIRAGDLVYFNYNFGATYPDASVDYNNNILEEHRKAWEKIYNGNSQATGHVALCTGEFERDNDGKLVSFNTIQENTHNRAKYGIGNSIVDEKEVKIKGENFAGFLRYIGNFQGEIQNACNIDFSKYIT